MPGPRPRDDSGPAVPVTIRLSPAHRELLDALTRLHLVSRSAVVAALLEADARPADPVGDPPPVAEAATRAPPRSKGRRVTQPVSACPHRKAVTRGRGPLMECPDCGARGINLRS